MTEEQLREEITFLVTYVETLKQRNQSLMEENHSLSMLLYREEMEDNVIELSAEEHIYDTV